MDTNTLSTLRSYLTNLPSTFGYLTPEELKARLDEDRDSVFLLDNRTPEFYRAGHIEGAENMPFLTVLEEENLARLPKDKPIVVCCWVGHTASQLMPILWMLGYQPLVLKYGMGKPRFDDEKVAGWDVLGYPTRRGNEP